MTICVVGGVLYARWHIIKIVHIVTAQDKQRMVIATVVVVLWIIKYEI
jgi:hypothetical protein